MAKGHGEEHGGEVSKQAAEPLAKYYTKAVTQKFDEYPRWPSSHTSGVIPMYLKGRWDGERERLGPEYRDMDREFRIKYLKSQELHPSEPLEVKQLYYEYNHILKRIWKWPGNQFEVLLQNFMKKENAMYTRRVLFNAGWLYVSILAFWYYAKYNRMTWEWCWRGLNIRTSREPMYPGEKLYPFRTESASHYHLKFLDRKVFLDDIKTSTPRYANGDFGPKRPVIDMSKYKCMSKPDYSRAETLLWCG